MVCRVEAGFLTIRSPFLEGPPAFPRSSVREQSHIQIAVVDRSSILGVFRPNIENRGLEMDRSLLPDRVKEAGERDAKKPAIDRWNALVARGAIDEKRRALLRAPQPMKVPGPNGKQKG